MALRSVGPAVNRTDNTHRLSHGKFAGVHWETIASAENKGISQVDVPITPSSQVIGSPGKPGRFRKGCAAWRDLRGFWTFSPKRLKLATQRPPERYN